MSLPESFRGGFVTKSGRPDFRPWIAGVIVFALLGLTAHPSGLDLRTIADGIPRLVQAGKGLIAIPDWSSFDRIAAALLETIEMALVGTVLSVPISFFFSLLVARNTSFHPAFAFLFRTIASIFRAVPFFVWAMLLIAVIGLGSAPGVLALVVTGSMFGTKMFADSLEHVDQGAVEGVQAAGAGWLETRRYGIIPQALSQIASNAVYQFEINIRMATAVGVVGAGGIGFLFAQAMRMVNYGRILLILLCIMALMGIVDTVGKKVREVLS